MSARPVTRLAAGRLTDLVLVRLHGGASDYLDARAEDRAGVVARCLAEATTPDLAARILGRTIYGQAASRAHPLRELVQNALDASPPGGHVEVRTSPGAAGCTASVTVSDRGRGMTARELLEDLLVPFRSGKAGDPEAIGEHGIGFLSALELAPTVEVLTRSPLAGEGALRLRIEPIGRGAPYDDFSFVLERAASTEITAGAVVTLAGLDPPLPAGSVAEDLARVAGFVDPLVATVSVDGTPVNTVRERVRRAAVAPVEGHGSLQLFVGKADALAPVLAVTQKGLLVSVHRDAFFELPLHREIQRALAAAGLGLVVDLPAGVPLNKGRSAVAAAVSARVDAAIATAFERFVLEDALHDRELLRRVDHRLAQVLDRLVAGAMAGEPPPLPAPRPAGKGLTVAASEEVVRLATSLLSAPLFTASRFDGAREEVVALSVRALLDAHRAGRLRALVGVRAALVEGSAPVTLRGPGFFPAREGEMLYLALDGPLAEALWRRISSPRAAQASALSSSGPPVSPVGRVGRAAVLAAEGLPGARALAAAMEVLERIDGAISLSAGLSPSPISIHQDLYGREEMAHTDGAGISVNLGSPRVRALLSTLLTAAEGSLHAALGSLVDLMLHEKAHVSLAGHTPRANAEHGVSFYRRKDALRRKLLEALAEGSILDPVRWALAARRPLDRALLDLPSMEALARAMSAQPC